MKFTTATNQADKQITIVFRSINLHHSLEISHSSEHIKDSEIREGLKASRYSLKQNKSPSYTVTGGTPSELKQVEEQLKVEYGLVEESDGIALLSRIAIEIAIGASQTNDRRQRLTTKNFPPGFDAVKASQNDRFMAVCVETGRNILEIVK